MSKHFAAIFFALPLILQLFVTADAQSLDVTISLTSVPPQVIKIKGSLKNVSNRRNIAFLDHYHGFTDLADRLSDLRLEDESGQTVAFRRFVPGEYVANSDVSSFEYLVDLKPARNMARAGHVSWIGSDSGILFLRDLLPLSTSKTALAGKITLELPQGWIWSKEDLTFDLADIDNGAIAIARNARTISGSSGDVHINTFITGDWKFTDQQANQFAVELINEYSDLFGGKPFTQAEINILPYPLQSAAGNWEADTVGNTINIVSSDMPFQTQSVQRLHEQLRHEVFHLWFPNGVALTGRYDWFYEGFALYQSLKTGVKLNRLRFDDFLDTLGRAMTIDSMMTENRSLIDASQTRASGSDTVIYARGMLAAFATDLELIRRSGGREDVSNLLKRLFQKYRIGSSPGDANAVILQMIDVPAVTQYVSGEPINWSGELRPFGIEAITDRSVTNLRIVSKPSSSQKKMLDKLGYNNWRKLSSAQK
jgi:hypothetical protein